MLFGNKRRAIATGGGGGMGVAQPAAALAGDGAPVPVFSAPLPARVGTQELHGRSELINRLLNRALVKQCPPELERLLSKPNLPRAFGAAPLPRRRAGPPPCPDAREARR